MMAYPPQQQLLRVPPHGSTAAPPLHLHDGQGSSNSKPDAVPSSSSLPADARGLRAVIKSLSSSSAAAVHAHATKLGLDRERTVRNALMSIYLTSGDHAAARALFDAFPGGRDVVSWTAMVTGHTRLGFPDSAASLFLALTDDDDVTMDAVAAAAGFAACADAGDLALARAAHRRVAKSKVPLDAVAWNALIDMYAKCGDLAASRKLFSAMPAAKKNVVTWNTMISALTRSEGSEHAGEALSLFREMQLAGGAQPDDATVVAVLGACARLGALDSGRWVHAYYLVSRLGRRTNADGVVGNALIDMYAKCGAVDHAAAVFDAMARRDAYTYASMITALATHGRARDALALFAAMRREPGGVRANAVALLGVLSACCHAGLVDEGLRLLRDMEEEEEFHGVAPGVEHYGCAVDMLGRAGRLDEAEALVAAMPVVPDALVWGALMAACRAEGDVERAERVMRRRRVAEEDGGADAGDHVLLANAYAAGGRHGSAVRVRREMRKKKIVKDPGCSLIEIDGVVHEFRAVPANSSIG